MKTGKFVRTEKQFDKELRGQAALVAASLDAHEDGADLAQITADIVELGLVTRQEPQRIALYYLAIFKKQGFIVQVVEKPTVKTAEVAEVVESGTETPEIITFEDTELAETK
jgi:transketolase C-terminal domain/subunit